MSRNRENGNQFDKHPVEQGPRGSNVVLRSLVVALALSTMGWTSLEAQEGFLVLRPMEVGEANIFINGLAHGTLENMERSIPLPVGVHRFAAKRAGFDDFVRQIEIKDGEPLSLTVRFQESGIRVVQGGEETGGTVHQQTGRMRIIHLEPLEVPVHVGSASLGNTPITLELPVGENTLRIGQTNLCVVVQPNIEAYVRIRGSAVEERRDWVGCEEIQVGLTVRGVPQGYGSPIVMRGVERLGLLGRYTYGGRGTHDFLATLPSGGRYEVLFGGEGLPGLSIPLAAESGDKVLVEIEAPRPPQLSPDTILPTFPQGVTDTVFSKPRPAPPQLNRAEIQALQARLSVAERYRGGETRGKSIRNVGGAMYSGGLLGMFVGYFMPEQGGLAIMGVSAGASLLGLLIAVKAPSFDPKRESSNSEFRDACGHRSQSNCRSWLQDRIASEQSRQTNPEVVAAYENLVRAWEEERVQFEANVDAERSRRQNLIEAYETRVAEVREVQNQNRIAMARWREALDSTLSFTVTRNR